MMVFGKWMKPVAGAVFSLGLVVLQSGTASAQQQDFPALVDVDKVVVQPLSQTMPVIGRFVARQRGVVSALTTGPVYSVEVEVGDRVAKGDLLVRLDSDVLTQKRNQEAAALKEARAALATAKESVALARGEQKRLERLKNSAAFSQARLDDKKREVARLVSEVTEAEATIARAEASLALARIDVNRSEIRAPFNGVIIEKHTERGAYLTAGGDVVTLLNDEDMEIEADVPANRIAGLNAGRLVPVEMVDGSFRDAIVRAVVPDENVLTRTRAVRFTPAQREEVPGQLAAGQSVNVHIPVGTARDVLTLHKDAILPQGDKNMVFVVAEGQAQPRFITYGEAVGNRVEILSGLAEGDVVVVRGNERIFPGQKVFYPGMKPAESENTENAGNG